MRVNKSKWNWLDAARATHHYGYLRLGWGYYNDQRRRAAQKAQKNKAIKRVKGPPGADHWRPNKKWEDPGGPGLSFVKPDPSLDTSVSQEEFNKILEWQDAYPE